ncbi:ribbon-helix-helix protein, CopG family [Candidatus Woesearchaeota archaeon]|jgi:Arc/MetJ-type ribon-helix-helix transcriptional regulator|nr:ribbon-helix-helix protein, CopG family [Candidatus Woesearchaeota archaeon]MBT3439015.1 ribbon-helix-helix protein, CopG family [Candidatus Woesearchaeota archaeon]MBT4058641.1 ribbon-helix-helix protein, CopG family [Candidatus Woesearchaeota archaeon]MBT4209224.1 ribbon-helix-helix protein, CopG family [Candidatus Woesearchaeota archaeon]MBT4730405.1 ribbon-helix-helix protein, CopG family [Candidatus Woesearchaeota archaeon]
MKTITIKLPKPEADKLDNFVKTKNYPSKSEFIRNLLRDKIEESQKEKQGWLALAEKSLEKIWNNKKDAETWDKYL